MTSTTQPAQPLMCSRCFAEVETLLPANCTERPDLLVNVPLGMYHCPDCGAMVCAGIPHGGRRFV